MFKQISVFIFCIFLGAFARAEFYLNSSADLYSNSFYIRDLKNDKPGAFKQSEEQGISYGHTRFESGWRNKHFSIAYLDRKDLVLDYSRDAALIYFFENTKQDNIPERVYDYELSVNNSNAKGFALGYFNAFQDLNYKLQLDLAETTDLYDGDIQGKLDFQGDTLNGDAEIEYYYHRDLIFEREVKPSEGVMTALHIDLSYALEKSTHTLQLRDLYSLTRWESAPYSLINIDSNRVGERDENGKLEIRPLGSGIEDFRDHKQRLPMRAYLENSFSHNENSVLLNVNYKSSELWPQFGYLWKQKEVSGLISPKDKSIKLKHRLSQHFEYSLDLDNLNLKRAQRINLSFELKAF